MDKIYVTRPTMPELSEYVREIEDLWESKWITNVGEKHVKLQHDLEKYLGVNHVELFVNGHFALESALEVFGFPTGGEIITTPYTFASTTHAIVRKGLVPVFCDIREDNFTIDVNRIEELIGPRTVAIVPVHVYGNVCDVDSIDEIAKKHNLPVIYDAAHAFGVRLRGVPVVSYGDISMISFHATKVFHTIEGGALCYDNDKLTQKLKDIKNFGIIGPEEIEYTGANGKMNEFAAAMGICNLKHIDEDILKRKIIADYYRKSLRDIDGIVLGGEDPDVEYNYSFMPILFNGYKYDRDTMASKLQEKGIFCRKYFYPLTSDFSCIYSSMDKRIDTPVAKKVSESVLTLPIYGDLRMEDIDFICSLIRR